MKKLLILGQNLTSFTVLSEVGNVAACSDFKVIFLYVGNKPTETDTLKSRCEDLSFDFRSISEFQAKCPIDHPLLKKHPRPNTATDLYRDCLKYVHEKNTRRLTPIENKKEKKLWGLIRSKLPPPFFEHNNVWPLQTNLALKMAHQIKCLEEIRPDAIITAADGVNGPLEILTAARQFDIPIVTVPYGFPLKIDLEISLDQKKEEGKLLTTDLPFGSFIEKHCNQWVKQGKNQGATMFVPEHIAALESIGVTLDRPWSVMGNLGDVLCAESDINREHYLAEDVPPKKIDMTGSPYCDLLHRSILSEDRFQKAFELSKPVEENKIHLLVSWPPSYHAKYVGQSEFSSYEEMTKVTLQKLTAIENLSITVSCHPAVDETTRKMIEQTGIEITNENIIHLIPQNDIYFTFFSSTTRWAIACGKVVLNYDMYKLAMNIYDQAPSVFTRTLLHDIEDILKDLCRSPEKLAEALARQKQISSKWGKIDGECTHRILNVINRLTLKRKLKSALSLSRRL